MKQKKNQEDFNRVVIARADGSAVLYDDAQIEKDFADILNFQRKQANKLLGTFIDGKYMISDKMTEELVSLPKKFDRVDDNVLYAATILGEFVLNFKIEMDISEDYCTAKLYLVEVEQGIEDDIKHLTQLAEVVEPYMFEFRKEICNRWNIYYNDEIMVKGDLYDYLHEQNEEFLFNRERVDLLSQYYLMRILALLGTMGPLGEKVMYEYERLIAEFMQKNPSLSQNNTMQKMILDYVLRQNDAISEIVKTEEGAKAMMTFSDSMKEIRDRAIPSIIEEISVEKKPEEKKVEVAPTVKTKTKPPKVGSVKSYVYSLKDYKAMEFGGKTIEIPIEDIVDAAMAGVAAVGKPFADRMRKAAGNIQNAAEEVFARTRELGKGMEEASGNLQDITKKFGREKTKIGGEAIDIKEAETINIDQYSRSGRTI